MKSDNYDDFDNYSSLFKNDSITSDNNSQIMKSISKLSKIEPISSLQT